MFKSIFVVAIAVCATAASLAAATFTDRDAFLLASGDVTTHAAPTIARSNRAAVNYGNGLTVSGIGSTNFASASSFGASENGIPGSVIISGLENLNFSFGSDRFGFGLNIFEPTFLGINGCNTAACFDGTFTFNFFKGSSVVGTESFSPANNVVTFFGVLLDTAFDRIEMRESIAGSDQSLANDNEFFGGFVSTDALAPVPLPASALLLIGGLAGLGMMRRKR